MATDLDGGLTLREPEIRLNLGPTQARNRALRRRARCLLVVVSLLLFLLLFLWIVARDAWSHGAEPLLSSIDLILYRFWKMPPFLAAITLCPIFDFASLVPLRRAPCRLFVLA
jgi:hypothetical protein